MKAVKLDFHPLYNLQVPQQQCPPSFPVIRPMMPTSDLPPPVSTSLSLARTTTDLWAIFFTSLVSDETLETVYGLLGVLQNIAGGCGCPQLYFSLAFVRTGVNCVKVSRNNVAVATKYTEHLNDIEAHFEAVERGSYTAGSDMTVITDKLRCTIIHVRESLDPITKRGPIKSILHSFTDFQTLEEIKKLENAFSIFQARSILALHARQMDTSTTLLNIRDNLQATNVRPYTALSLILCGIQSFGPE
ncbi:hypothetical protein JB92DRAFT_2860406 [Gautieria morchelliformis]|nr:hypothetical protein JB92DRAFT_2860406 [Gautieria morchelliformis]